MRTDVREPMDLSALLRCGVALFAVATLYSGFAQRGDKPVYFVLAVVGAAAALLLITLDRGAPVLRSPVLVWVYLFLIVTIGWGLWRTAVTPATDQEIVDRFRSMAFFVAMAVVFDDERARKVGGIAVVLVALASSVGNVAEALGAITFPDDPGRVSGRAAGLYENPNGSGLAIVFGLAAGLAALPRALRVPALLVAACGVTATFSRGSAACLAALVAVLLWQRALPPFQALVVAGGAGAALVARRTVLEGTLAASGALNENTLARLAMTADDSGRRALAGRAWQLLVDAPWIGHGVAIERAGRVAHNMYLSLGVEHGIVGVLAYPAFVLALCFRHPAALGTGAVCLLAGFTSHNLLETEPVLLCCALAAARAPSPVAATTSMRVPAASRTPAPS